MTLYRVALTPRHHEQLGTLTALRLRLGREAGVPRPWLGALRRQARATTASSSTAIEGFFVAAATALEQVDRGTESADPALRAFAGYALAMHHVAVLASDPRFVWSDRVLLDLHFEACSAHTQATPGRCRDRDMVVTAPGGGVAYRAPGPAQAEALLDELVAWLTNGDLDLPVVVRAALAHLNLVSIHPFRDGNGRVSRILQSLVLAREGLLAPELGSIEEHLATHTGAYYAALQEVQGGSWQPDRDAGPWLSFCLEAHRLEAAHRLAQLAAAGQRWAALEALVSGRGWPERLVIALERSLGGGADRAGYAAEAGVSIATASADLRRLLDAGLVSREGLTRNARYHPTEALRAHLV